MLISVRGLGNFPHKENTMQHSIESLLSARPEIPASDSFKQHANFQDAAIYEEARSDRLKFWAKQAEELQWIKPFSNILEWNRPFAKWFSDGQLNAAANCLDIHLETEKKSKKALIWEGEDGEVKTLTYTQLHDEVGRFAYALQSQFKIQKGDRITIYLPMIPEIVIAVLACARIGAIHSVVFGGFSADSLRDRIEDSTSRILITADGGYRRGGIVPLLDIANQATQGETSIEKTIVVQRFPEKPQLRANQVAYSELMAQTQEIAKPESMNAEDPLFILYTSGTTGKPKGILHSTGGYMTHAKYSTKAVFDLKDQDIYWCTADVGWITGHTYLIYGPLANGATVLLYEGTPDFPDKDRFWALIAKHKVSIFYTAPTAIRTFMKWGPEYISPHDLSSLRLLGSVGEPINPEAWMWYYTQIGKSNCPLVDTWWQTETGGIMISNLPALNAMKPGYTGLPLPGIDIAVVDAHGKTISEGGGLLTITEPWPSMARGIWNDNARFESVYWSKFATYFAGDGAKIDADGYVMVLGRVDDVLNVSGHRIGTMEVESTLVDFKGVAEAAVVGMPDEIKGQAILAFVTLKESQLPSTELENQLIHFVGEKIGAIAKPKKIIFTPELPKTRSGKIMRRVLKAIAVGEPAGDVSTLANPQIVEDLQRKLFRAV